MLKNVLWRIAATGLLAVLAACGGTAPGSIKLTVSAPSGVTPSIDVTGGPDNITQTVVATGITTVGSLKAGSYTVTSKKQTLSGIGYNSNPVSVTLNVADAEVPLAVDYVAISGRAAVTVSNIPAASTAAVKLKKNGVQVGTTISANGTQNFDELDPTSASVAYTIEAPNITVGATTYSSSANGSVVTITKGVSTPVAVSYALGSGAANITVSGLGGTTTAPVNISLTPQPSGTAITKTVTTDGIVNFPNLAPGNYTLSAAGATVGTQDFGATYTPANATVAVTSGATATGTVAYVKPSISVTVTGVTGTGNVRVTVQKGTDAAVVGNGTTAAAVKVEVPTFGNYSVNVAATQAGTNVDSALSGVAAANVTVSAAVPAATSSVAVTARGGTGKLYVAGNGLFNPSGLNGAYSLADAAIVNGAVLPSFGVIAAATEGVLRISFDAAGNAYVIKQDSTNARIIKISEANLKTNTLTEAANLTIAKGAFSTTGGESEPADLAFDATGNLWIANDNGNTVACVSATRLAATTGTIGSPADKLLTAPAGTFTVTGFAATTISGANLYKNIHTLAFDAAGNLWFVSGGFVGPAATPARFAVLARVPAASLTCSGGAVATTPDLMLNISNGSGAGGPTIKPVAMALAPSGTAFYIADFGGSSDYYKCVTDATVVTNIPPCGVGFKQVKSDTQGGPTLDANFDPETIIKVNISGLTPSATNVQTGTIADRIKYPAVGGTNRGMQQAFGLAFDKSGNLWVATNNNVEVNNAVGAGNVTGACDDPALKKVGDPVGTTYTCLPTTALTDRMGKLYRFKASDVNGIPAVPAEFGRDLTPDITISAPTVGTGLVGVAFNTPPANSPMNVRPTQ